MSISTPQMFIKRYPKTQVSEQRIYQRNAIERRNKVGCRIVRLGNFVGTTNLVVVFQCFYGTIRQHVQSTLITAPFPVLNVCHSYCKHPFPVLNVCHSYCTHPSLLSQPYLTCIIEILA